MTKLPTKKRIKKVKEKGYMFLFWGTHLSKKVFKDKASARREMQNEIEPNHCASCECSVEKSEVQIVEVTLTYTLTK